MGHASWHRGLGTFLGHLYPIQEGRGPSPFPTSDPASFEGTPWEAAGDGSNLQGPVTQVGDPGGVLGTCLWPSSGLCLATVGNWREERVDGRSLCVCVSAREITKERKHRKEKKRKKEKLRIDPILCSLWLD